MKINKMFASDINRTINGVIKAMQTDDENRKQELEEYVITRELRKHFKSFYDRYEMGIQGHTDKMGVWISGFFGSGKSHFLKILSYLLANKEIEGLKPVEVLSKKLDDAMDTARMVRCSSVPTEVILFNIDAKAPVERGDGVILRIFTKVFYEYCGFYGDDMKVARFERFLARKGKLEAFKQAFQQLHGDPWDVGRESFSFWEEEIVTALIKTVGIAESAARNWFNGKETAELSIDLLSREVGEYVDSKGKDFHLVFLADEIGQFIGGNSAMMVDFQTVVEALGSRCRGKVWVIVTSQEAIDTVTKVKGNDFSKIQDRFNTRLSLSSISVDEVIKRRLLEKTNEAVALLRLLYKQNESVMRNLFTFSQGTVADLKGYSGEDEFIASYPFIPYQFKLLYDALAEIRRHGASGSHLSGGERSMLSSFQEAAQSIKDYSEGALIPFYQFYDTISTILEGHIRYVIDRADQAARAGNGLEPFDVDLLKLLFLLRYVEGVPCNVENLATLMVSDIQADKVIMRGKIQKALDRLVQQNYVSRSGDSYMFLTDDEQAVNREIRDIAVEQSEVIHQIGQIIFGSIYPGRKFRYGIQDFNYDPYIDDSMVGNTSGEIRLRVVTVLSDLNRDGSDFALLTKSKTGEVIAVLDPAYPYYSELEEKIKIEKYARLKSGPHLAENTRKIIANKQEEAHAHEKRVEEMLRDAILKGRIYAAGERLNKKCITVKEKLDDALSRLIESVYSKLDYVTDFVQSDAEILSILNRAETQETINGIAPPDRQALDDIMQYLDLQKMKNAPVTMANIVKRYQAAPYGWREIDIAALVASLIKGQRLQMTYGGAIVPVGERRMVDYLRKRTETDKAILKIRPHVGIELIDKARATAGQVFKVMDLKNDEVSLCEQLISLLHEARDKNKALAGYYLDGKKYPGKTVVEEGQRLFDGILSKRSDNAAFLTAFAGSKEALLDYNENFAEVDFFFKNQKEIYDQAQSLEASFDREKDYFMDAAQALAAGKTISEILRMDRPYRRVMELPTLMQTINEAYKYINDVKRERVNETLVQARGDIHTLGADYHDLKEMIRQADDYLDGLAKAALECCNATELDAMVTKILTHKDTICKKMEAIIAGKRTEKDPPPKLAVKIVTLRRYDVFPQKRLASPSDIEVYLNDLKDKLTKALEGNDAIQLN